MLQCVAARCSTLNCTLITCWLQKESMVLSFSPSRMHMQTCTHNICSHTPTPTHSHRREYRHRQTCTDTDRQEAEQGCYGVTKRCETPLFRQVISSYAPVDLVGVVSLPRISSFYAPTVAVCCSVLQCVAVCCNVLQCVAACFSL